MLINIHLLFVAARLLMLTLLLVAIMIYSLIEPILVLQYIMSTVYM